MKIDNYTFPITFITTLSVWVCIALNYIYTGITDVVARMVDVGGILLIILFMVTLYWLIPMDD